MATCGAGGGQAVAAIASFGQRVGAKAQANTLVHDFIDDVLVGPFIEVVHKLCALVTKKSSVFKLDRTFHAINASPH